MKNERPVRGSNPGLTLLRVNVEPLSPPGGGGGLPPGGVGGGGSVGYLASFDRLSNGGAETQPRREVARPTGAMYRYRTSTNSNSVKQDRHITSNRRMRYHYYKYPLNNFTTINNSIRIRTHKK